MEQSKPLGGSELAYYTLAEKLEPGWDQNINLILSFCYPQNLIPNKINVIWQQLNWNEDSVANMANDDFVKSVDYFAWVSHWQYDRFRNKFNIPAYKSIILKNATPSVEFQERSRTGKLKLIYTSTPWRGLDIVLEAFRLLNRDDIELDIYSSTKIYGPNFEKITEGQFDWLFDIARNMPNVNYHGYAPNALVRQAVNNSHIFAYPSTFEETSCISAIEALTSGCRIVTTNYGALPETCGDWATYVPYGPNRQVLAERYATVLNYEINMYWSNYIQQHIRDQNAHYNKFWSWETRLQEWNSFFKSIQIK